MNEVSRDLVQLSAPLQNSVIKCSEVAGLYAEEVDRESRFPIEAVEAIRKERLLSCAVPAGLGGMGLSIKQLGYICFELGSRCASTAMIFAMHQSQLLTVLRHASRSPIMRDFIGDCCDHQFLIASATSERGVRGSIRSSVASFEIKDDHLSLEKDCPTISYGEFADAILVTANLQTSEQASIQKLALLGRGEYKLVRTVEWDALGMRGTCSHGFRLSAASSRKAILEEEFRLVSAKTMTPVAHILWASVWRGIAYRSAETARKLFQGGMRSRKEVRLSDARLSAMSTNLNAMAAVAESAADRFLGAGDTLPGAKEVIMINDVKLIASSLALDVCIDAMKYCGMAGYLNTSKYSVGRNLRDIVSAPLMISNDAISEINSALLMVGGASV